MCYSALVKAELDFLERNYGATRVREQIDRYVRRSQRDPKRFPSVAERIFPGHYAPVIFGEGAKKIELMRYSAYPPAGLADRRDYTTFNARRDNLTSPFWAGAFQKHHGFVVLERFYEWVAVGTLLQAGLVTLKQVQQEFAQQAAARKLKVEAAGKKYKPTPTELKDPRFRQIIIEFLPRDAADLLVPVIFSEQMLEDGMVDRGFAIVTDDPPPEIREAGHDRCPIILEREAMEIWLHPRGKSAAELQELLVRQRRVHFQHQLPIAA